MELVIITGMSGAGKSTVANILEDIGFYCMDNIPPAMIKPIIDLSNFDGSDSISKLAIVTDIRGHGMFNDLLPALRSLDSAGIKYKVLFLDASDEKLLNRYKETRRRHPLAAEGQNKSTSEMLEKEREILDPIRSIADYTVDTSESSTSSLKMRIIGIFSGDTNNGMKIQCMSFGFKYGPAVDADLIFDVRCLKNPFYVAELRAFSGIDKPVKDFIEQLPETGELKKRLFSLLDYTVPMYCREGKSQLVIAMGCTGGKHRSVYFAETVYNHLKQAGYDVSVVHRDITKDR